MASIAELYRLNNSSSTGGIEGYHVEKKYIDPMKMKQQRILSASKDKVSHAKPANISKKTTFIDDVQKQSSKLPGPTSYETLIKDKSKTKIDTIINHPDRKTVFDELQQKEKKKNVPGVGNYGKIQTEVDKTKLRPNLSRAESPTYLQASMRKSLDNPGVGNYNAYRAVFDKRGTRWVQEKGSKKKSQTKIKLPQVGTYNPNPQSFRLFSGINQTDKKKTKVNKEERFKKSKQKKLPFYNILSEWGMKGKLSKKDILTKISSHPNTSRSLYY